MLDPDIYGTREDWLRARRSCWLFVTMLFKWLVLRRDVTAEERELDQLDAAQKAADRERQGKPTFAVDPEVADTIANEAIGLFLEYRDQHGYTERDARQAVVREIAEGASEDQLVRQALDPEFHNKVIHRSVVNALTPAVERDGAPVELGSFATGCHDQHAPKVATHEGTGVVYRLADDGSWYPLDWAEGGLALVPIEIALLERYVHPGDTHPEETKHRA